MSSRTFCAGSSAFHELLPDPLQVLEREPLLLLCEGAVDSCLEEAVDGGLQLLLAGSEEVLRGQSFSLADNQDLARRDRRLLEKSTQITDQPLPAADSQVELIEIDDQMTGVVLLGSSFKNRFR